MDMEVLRLQQLIKIISKMLKEKIRNIVEKDVTLSILILFIGLLNKTDSGRGIPFPWVNGSNVNLEHFFDSFLLILCILFAVDSFLLYRNKPTNVTSTSVQPAHKTLNIPNYTVLSQDVIDYYAGKTDNRQTAKKERTVSKKQNNAGFIIAFLVFLFGILPGMLFSAIEDTGTNDIDFSTASYTTSEQACIETIEKLSNNEDIGFDTSQVKEEIDWGKLLEDIGEGSTIFTNNIDDDGTIKLIYADEGKIYFKVTGTEVESDDGTAEVVGIMLVLLDDDFEYTEIYSAGDCKVDAISINDYY